jgi:uncharacterized membrane protein (DUF441 family)
MQMISWILFILGLIGISIGSYNKSVTIMIISLIVITIAVLVKRH